MVSAAAVSMRVTASFVALCERGQREEQDEEEQTQSNRLFIGLVGNRHLLLFVHYYNAAV